MAEELELWVAQQVRDVALGSSEQVVRAHYFVATAEQALDQV